MTVNRGKGRIWTPEDAAAEGAAAVAGRLDRISQQLGIPTHPEYDSTNFPDNAIPGQIVRDKNDMETLWVYGSDNAWHRIGGSANLPWAVASVQDMQRGSGLPYADTIIPFCPSNQNGVDTGNGFAFYLSNDADIYDALGTGDPLQKGININKTGAYIVMLSTWTAAVGNYTININDVASTIGLTSLNVSNYINPNGRIASKIAFYNYAGEFDEYDHDYPPFYAGIDAPPFNVGGLLTQDSGSLKNFVQTTLLIVRISDGFLGFLP